MFTKYSIRGHIFHTTFKLVILQMKIYQNKPRQLFLMIRRMGNCSFSHRKSLKFCKEKYFRHTDFAIAVQTVQCTVLYTRYIIKC